jgi:hypothetical protein
LPAVPGASPWIIVACDEASAVALDDIEPSVCLSCIKHTADVRREAVAAIAAGAREQDPILVAGLFARVLSRLIDTAVVDDNVACVVHRVRLPGFD